MTSEKHGRAPESHPAAFHLTDATAEDTSPWSAGHLPDPAPPRVFRAAAVAAAAGLAIVVLTLALGFPIRTAGTQMEPQRFRAALEPAAVPAFDEATRAP